MLRFMCIFHFPEFEHDEKNAHLLKWLQLILYFDNIMKEFLQQALKSISAVCQKTRIQEYRAKI